MEHLQPEWIALDAVAEAAVKAASTLKASLVMCITATGDAARAADAGRCAAGYTPPPDGRCRRAGASEKSIASATAQSTTYAMPSAPDAGALWLAGGASSAAKKRSTKIATSAASTEPHTAAAPCW